MRDSPAGGSAAAGLFLLLFHPVLSGIMIAALMVAVVSSADSCLASLSSIAMEDVYRRHVDLAAIEVLDHRVVCGKPRSHRLRVWTWAAHPGKAGPRIDMSRYES